MQCGSNCRTDRVSKYDALDLSDDHLRSVQGKSWCEAATLSNDQFFPDPLVTYGRSRWGVQPKPTWLEDENAVLVEYMTGFRMSFRTNVIRASGFDETLGGYALFEDVDASFQVLKTHLLVGARNAKIFHYKVPTVSWIGSSIGAMQILNRAYVLKRHVASYDAFPVQELRRFNVYKLMQYVDRRRIETWSGALKRRLRCNYVFA